MLPLTSRHKKTTEGDFPLGGFFIIWLRLRE